MLSKRLAVIALGTALAGGGTAVAAHAAIAGGTDDAKSPTSTSEAPDTTVPSAPHPFQINVPGIGTVSFVFDPATGAITNLVVTPLPGITAGTPTTGPEGIQIPVTLADGTMQVVKLKPSTEDGGFKVEVEAEAPEQQDQAKQQEAENEQEQQHAAELEQEHAAELEQEHANEVEQNRGPNPGPGNGDANQPGRDDSRDGSANAGPVPTSSGPGPSGSESGDNHGGGDGGGDHSGSGSDSGGGHGGSGSGD